MRKSQPVPVDPVRITVNLTCGHCSTRDGDSVQLNQQPAAFGEPTMLVCPLCGCTTPKDIGNIRRAFDVALWGVEGPR